MLDAAHALAAECGASTPVLRQATESLPLTDREAEIVMLIRPLPELPARPGTPAAWPADPPADAPFDTPGCWCSPRRRPPGLGAAARRRRQRPGPRPRRRPGPPRRRAARPGCHRRRWRTPRGPTTGRPRPPGPRLAARCRGGVGHARRGALAAARRRHGRRPRVDRRRRRLPAVLTVNNNRITGPGFQLRLSRAGAWWRFEKHRGRWEIAAPRAESADDLLTNTT